MSTAGSVSKGCFVFKGKKKSAKAENYLPKGKDSQLSRDRYGTYQDLLEAISTDLQVLQSNFNTKVFDDLLHFIEKSPCQVKNAAREIPTAALITGVNMPDHEVMFNNLLSTLKERVTPHIALLHSKDCPNMKSIISKTVMQLMQNPNLLDDEDEDQVNVKRISCTMDVLSSWYKHTTQKGSSPKKRKSQGGAAVPIRENPPVVIVLEDMEAFPPHVLQDFITVCSNHLRDLPVVLVFGIATAVTAIHRLLPHAVSSLLCIEKFQAPPSTEYFTHVLNQVVMTNRYPFRLGSRVFKLLMDLFLFHDFSVINFVRGFFFAMLDHFYSNQNSILCCPLEDASSIITGMRHGQLEDLRKTASFRRHVEKCPPKEQIQLLTEDDYFKKAVIKFLEDLEYYHKCFFPILSILHILTSTLPKNPLGKQVREVYSRCIQSDVFETEGYKEAFGLLQSLSRDELVSNLQKCLSSVSSSADLPQALKDIPEELQQFLSRLENLENLSQTAEEEEEEEGATIIPKGIDMHTLRKTLQELGKKKKLSVYEVLRNEILEYFDKIFRSFLKSPKSCPLHEVYYYDNVSMIRRHLNGSPRATIQTGLSNPYYYLQNELCKCEAGGISGTLPDICIVYKLHLECGRLINLYDWLQSFVTVIHAGDDVDDDDDDDDARTPNRELQARFIHAVSELQFLGFIKPTKRKTDHVARLTWGGC